MLSYDPDNAEKTINNEQNMIKNPIPSISRKSILLKKLQG